MIEGITLGSKIFGLGLFRQQVSGGGAEFSVEEGRGVVHCI